MSRIVDVKEWKEINSLFQSINARIRIDNRVGDGPSVEQLIAEFRQYNHKRYREYQDCIANFAFAVKISNKRIKIFYKNDTTEIIEFLQQHGCNDNLITTAFWNQIKATSCRRYRFPNIIYKTDKKSKNRPRIKIIDNGTCFGTCDSKDHACLPKHYGGLLGNIFKLCHCGLPELPPKT